MIKITERLRPYSHRPGTQMLIPGTTNRVTIFPTRIEVVDLSGAFPVEIEVIELPLPGPIHKFTAQLDLERGEIKVWGESQDGFFRYRIRSSECAIKWEKGDYPSIPLSIESKALRTPIFERLSLGCSKKQDWDFVMRRFKMDEIFPYWYHLAQLLPHQEPAKYEGVASLLPGCCNAIMKEDRNNLLDPFENLFRAGFEGILSPRLTDDDFNGFNLKSISPDSKANPLSMLIEGALLMRSLFIQREDAFFKVLPALPVPFHAGRLLNVACGSMGKMDLEWTKKTIRRMVFRADSDGEIQFQFQKGLKRFRLIKGKKSQGVLLKVGESIHIGRGTTYILDRFEA